MNASLNISCHLEWTAKNVNVELNENLKFLLPERVQ